MLIRIGDAQEADREEGVWKAQKPSALLWAVFLWENIMRELNSFELNSVAGGDKWSEEQGAPSIKKTPDTDAGWGSENRMANERSGARDSAPSWACSALGAGAGIAAGLVTTGAVGAASIITLGATLPAAPVIGTVVGGVVGGYVTYNCNTASGRP